MFHKKVAICSSFLISLLMLMFAVDSVSAGGSASPAATATIAASSSSITAGESVTFTVTFSCVYQWSTATGQLFNGSTMTSQYKLGNQFQIQPQQVQSQSVLRPQGVSQIITTQIVEFSQPGTYSVNVFINDVDVITQHLGECDISTSAPAVVLVAKAPVAETITTTTTTTTTTVAPTTTTVRATSLPKTGTDTNNALVALAVTIAGGAVILSRRRLVTK